MLSQFPAFAGGAPMTVPLTHLALVPPTPVLENCFAKWSLSLGPVGDQLNLHAADPKPVFQLTAPPPHASHQGPDSVNKADYKMAGLADSTLHRRRRKKQSLKKHRNTPYR